VTEPDDPTPADDGLDLARDIAKSYRGKASPMPPPGKRRVRPAKPARAARDEPSRLADLLGEVVNDQGWEERLAAQRVFTDWAGIVGPEVAQHSEVISFDDGEVEVRTDSTAWATQLRLLAPRIVAKLNELMGDGSVLRIQVRGPQAPSWKKGPRTIRGARGPRDTYG
jgi:predicted nucleic acid-binding Zn ribbon protein